MVSPQMPSTAPTMDYFDFPQYNFDPSHLAHSINNHAYSQPSPNDATYTQTNLADEAVVEQRQHESKPRLSKDQQEVLEQHFAEQPKPSTSTKKQYAVELDVPIEKINNWFQNRRAKVKQDAKKLQNSARGNVFYKGPFTAEQSSAGEFSPTFVDSSFYEQMNLNAAHYPHHLDPSSLQMPDVQIPSNHIDQSRAMNHAIAHMPGDVVPLEPLAADSNEVFDAFFGLDEQSSGTRPIIDYQSVSAFSKQFSNTIGSFDPYRPMGMECDNHYTTSTPNSLMTRSSHDSTFNPMQSPSLDDQVNSLSASTSLNDANMMLPRSFNNTGSSDSLASWSRGLIDDARRQFPVHMQSQPLQRGPQPIHDHSSAPIEGTETQQSQIIPTQTLSLNNIQEGTQNSNNSLNGSLSINQASATSNEPQPPPRQMMSFKHPATSSSLAARRQHRPAALKTATLRSLSFNGAATTSPTGSGHNLAPDVKLRRIQSTNGVNQGRISKCNLPAQRSPLQFSFADAMAVPTASRLPFSTVAESNESLIPDSPITPFGFPDGFAPYSDDSILHAQMNMQSFDGTASPSGWNVMHNSREMQSLIGSSPTTPLEAAQMAQLQLGSAQPNQRYEPPHSAPAWQQSFFGHNMQHADSMPVIVAPQPISSFWPPAAINEPAEPIPLSKAEEPSPAIRTDHKNQHIFAVNSDAAASSKKSPEAQHIRKPAPPPSFSSMQSTFVTEPTLSTASPPKSVSPPKTPAEFVVHEYAPRSPAETSKLPPRSKPSQSSSQEPKHYTFHHHRQEDFSSP